MKVTREGQNGSWSLKGYQIRMLMEYFLEEVAFDKGK
jgi:hypothetical protein